MSFFENITFRRNRTRTVSETITEAELSNSTIDGSTNSLPDISVEDNDEIRKLRQQIEELQTELCSAHEEINNLSTENSELKKTISDLKNKHEIVNKATKNLMSELGTPKKSKKTITPRRTSNNQNQQKLLLDGVKQRVEFVDSPLKPCPAQDAPVKTAPESVLVPNKIKPEKHKLCIISSNKTNTILTTAERTFPNCQICHYLTPNCGLLNLITDIELKLKNYTLDDYCLIFIGEEDFRRTNDYYDLIINIRETLSKIQHTNIIICLPTFKFKHSLMFNCRIELFNNMLYLDVCTHEYAYLFDSNLDLSYDYNMFSKKNGSLNNYGLNNIFENLNQLMYLDISGSSKMNTQSNSNSKTSATNNASESNELFFLE